MGQTNELPPFSSLVEFSPTLGLEDTLMGGEAVHKGHLFLLGPVPRGKRLSTGEGPLWSCKQAPFPPEEIYQFAARAHQGTDG